MKRLSLAVALAFAAGPALAADLPQPPPPQAPATYVPIIAPVYNWGGIYWGINGGYGIGTSEWTNATSTPSSTGDFSVNGFVVGPTLGFNLQSDAFVFGIEGDLESSWLDGKETSAMCGGIACETKNTWLGTFRARVGYAADRVLFYATAGGAYGNIQSGVNGGFDKSSEPGWTAGAGVEAAFADNWTARIEYLFVDLENGSCTISCIAPGSATTTTTTVKLDASLVRFGVDYKFR